MDTAYSPDDLAFRDEVRQFFDEAYTPELQQRLLHRWVTQTCQQQLSAALNTEIWRQLQKPGQRPPIALSDGWQLQAEACMLKLIPPAAAT